MTRAAPSRIDTLLSMLTYRRPAGSKTERKFIRRFIEPLGVEQDAAGNLIKRIGDAPILWSCHTDTVHRDGGMQHPVVSSGIVRTPHGSNCLGADCTTGVWLMVEMIRAGIPGLYIFHRQEEWGGVGSAHIADVTPGLLAGIDCAIAFDRRGYTSVVTHQAGWRCCSDEFAVSLVTALGMPGLDVDPGGTFTDTANYTHLVPECTNISVGYFSQHTSEEEQDLGFAERLLDAVLGADFSKLVVRRDPADDCGHPPVDARHDRVVSWHDDRWWDDDALLGHPETRFGARHTHNIRSLLRDHADELAEWLEDNGIGAKELIQEIEIRGGRVV